MMRYTFCVDTQISTSRELNRVEDRIKFILHGESTLLILLIMELEEKVKELIKWYMDTYGVNKDQAVRDIESVMLRISHK